MNGVLKKVICLVPVLLVLTAGGLYAQHGGGIQSASNIESHISFTSVLRGLLGIATLIGIAWLFSNNRKAVSWKVVDRAGDAVAIGYRNFVCAFCAGIF